MNELRPAFAKVRRLRAERGAAARCGAVIPRRAGASLAVSRVPRFLAAAACLFLLSAPSRASAQFLSFAPFSAPAAPQTPLPAVVRVISPERDGASLGSGTLVDVSPTHGLVLTNWHVVRDAAGNVIVSFPDGFQSPGYVLKMDRDWDLAAVAVWRPHVTPIPIASAAPRPGEILTIAGYGAGNYRAISGPCTEYLSPGPGFPYEIVELHAAARHGDSGGPILNGRGELAGVLFGEGGGDTSGTFCGRVRVFLNSIAAGSTPFIASAARPANRIGSSPLLPGPLVQQPAIFAPPNIAANAPGAGGLNSSTSGISLLTTNYPPITLPGVPITGSSSASEAFVATSRPPPPSPETALAASSDPRKMDPRSVDPHSAGPLAAILSPLPPMPDVDSAGSQTGQSSGGQAAELGWEQIAGHTFGQQLKTVLAGIGAILVLLQLIRKFV